jgi:hypothetical protein
MLGHKEHRTTSAGSAKTSTREAWSQITGHVRRRVAARRQRCCRSWPVPLSHLVLDSGTPRGLPPSPANII